MEPISTTSKYTPRPQVSIQNTLIHKWSDAFTEIPHTFKVWENVDRMIRAVFSLKSDDMINLFIHNFFPKFFFFTVIPFKPITVEHLDGISNPTVLSHLWWPLIEAQMLNSYHLGK